MVKGFATHFQLCYSFMQNNMLIKECIWNFHLAISIYGTNYVFSANLLNESKCFNCRLARNFLLKLTKHLIFNCRTPEQCPSVVSLLAESYNPHVRYGAAMALGIACAGTGLREAIALLEPMAKFDPINFVRQGALVSTLNCLLLILF